MERAGWADVLAFPAKDAFRAVQPLPRIIGHVHVHRAYPLALPAGDAFVLVAFDPDTGIVAHGFQENRDGTYILAKRTVIFEYKRKDDANEIVQNIANDK